MVGDNSAGGTKGKYNRNPYTSDSMENPAPKSADWAPSPPLAKAIFGTLLLLLVVIAVGHLYVLEGLTALYLGLPLWIWLELGVVFAMLLIAWFAVQLVATATEGDS
ncbi:hypothetical protein [Salinibaculum rarum]|uniref:hypothetical protein n=1 Tax=Salinibaculum rarum TaxID=3058903 RepID=UPI0026601180|nr:hypothetical protein [Salinibaculum sp. KK48]